MSELLEQLQAAGAVEARGGFSIDPEKAREKLRQYQLADPQRYVLLLVEAAVSCGASKLEFEIDSDDLHLRFDGTHFRFEQLENIYGSLFASIGEVAVDELARLHGLRQLAFAINSAMALNPRFVRVVSVAANGTGARLELRPDSADQIERIEPDSAATPGNWVHVKDRFRPGLVVEFFRNIRGNLIESKLIREHCKWSRTPIFVNGEQVSGPVEFRGHYWTEVDVFDPPEGGERIGSAVFGLMNDAEGRLVDSTADLLANGVFIERVAVPGVWSFSAIVDSPRFGKDVSQTKLLRDAGFDAVMKAIVEAQGRAVARLAERCTAGAGPSWAHDLLLAWLATAKLGGLRKALRDDEIFALVAEVPLWPVVGAANVSTRALIECEGPIRYALEDFEFAPVDVPFVLALANDDGRVRARLLDKLFDRTKDYTQALRREHERQRNRLEFMTRTHLPELGDGYFPIRESFAFSRALGGSIRGEVGLRVVAHHGSWIRLIHQGCLLQEVAIDHPLPGLCAVVQAELSPDDGYAEARPTEALAAALVSVLEALLRAMTGLAASGAVTAQATELRELVRGFIAELVHPEYATKFLMQFGFDRSQARRELGRLLDESESAIRPDWRLDDPAGPSPLAEVPLFARVHESPCSLAELQALRAAGKPILWLEAKTGALPLLDVDVVLLDMRDRDALRAIFGNDALESFAEQLGWIRRRDAFLQRPSAALELPHASLARSAVRAGTIRGELGLREFSYGEAGEGRSPIAVFYRERKLCKLDLELPLPGLHAWVESDAFELTQKFDALAHPLALREPLLAALVGLVELEIGRALRQPRDLRRCEWWFLTMVPNLVLGGGGLAQAFVQLRKARGQAQALADLDALLGLHERYPERDLARALGRLRGRDELPTPEAIDEQLRRPSRRLGDGEREALALRRNLVGPFGQLLELPLFRKFTGSPVDGTTPRVLTLASFYDCVGAGEPISWVGEDYRIDAMPRLGFDVAGLDPIEQRLLQDQLGVQGLELVGEWLQGRARFERRRTIDEVRVPRGAALTVVEVSGTGWRGELGLVRESPRNVQRSKIRVFTNSREAATVDLPAKPIPVIGALSFDELELTDRFDDVTADERERIRSLVQSRIDELIVDLVARYAQLSRADKPRAAELVRHLLANWPPNTGGYAARSNKRPKLFRALAELPVFAGARKRWSAAELAEARERGPIATIGYRKDVPLPDMAIVLLDGEDVEPTLATLFGPTRDLYAELERERQLAARKASAPPMPSEPPSGALASLAIAGERLEGYLWISPRREQEVLFGADGRAADSREVAAYCQCGGAIWGVGLNILDDWSRVVLSRSQERMLERRAVELWSNLLDDFVRISERETPRTSAGRQRFVSMRDALNSLFLKLHGALAEGRSGSAGKRKRKQGNRFERLYERTREAPLLELSNGRFVSANVAARERPIELASYNLWSGPSAEELAHERAIARCEAQRRRDAEREAQRQAEAERRRLAAEAREREAARRRAAKREAERLAREQQAREQQAREQQAREREAAKASRPPEPPSPEQLLLDAVREELRLVRAENRGLVSNRLLESLVLGAPVRRGSLFRHVDGRTEIDTGHPLFRAALASYLDDPALVTLLGSAAYTFLNIIHVEIADVDEAKFLQLHAAHAATIL